MSPLNNEILNPSKKTTERKNESKRKSKLNQTYSDTPRYMS